MGCLYSVPPRDWGDAEPIKYLQGEVAGGEVGQRFPLFTECCVGGVWSGG